MNQVSNVEPNNYVEDVLKTKKKVLKIQDQVKFQIHTKVLFNYKIYQHSLKLINTKLS